MRQQWSAALRQLRKRRVLLRVSVSTAQAHVRGYLIRKRYASKLDAAREDRIAAKRKLVMLTTCLQAVCRGYLLRQRVRPELMRVREEREAEKVRFQDSVVGIQAHCRGHLLREIYAEKLREQMQRRKQLQQVMTSPSKNTSNSNSPKSSPSTGKPKLTILRRLQSALKIIHPTPSLPSPSLPSPSLPSPAPLSSSLPTSSNKTTARQSECESSNSTPSLCSPPPPVKQQVFSAPPFLGKSFTMPEPGPQCDPQCEGEGDTEEDCMSEDEDTNLAAEEKALQDVVRSREEEIAVAQLARERMSTIFSEDEIKLMAERQRKRGSYQKELEHAAMPLLPRACLGIVEDRFAHWKASCVASKKAKRFVKKLTVDKQVAEEIQTNYRPLTTAQLLAASVKGTTLEQVDQVAVYGSRHPVDLSSLQKCPGLRTATLVQCGLESLAGLVAPNLWELQVPVSITSDRDILVNAALYLSPYSLMT